MLQVKGPNTLVGRMGEFFYIHIERYVRGIIASGVKSEDSIHITPIHELCRSLILHYNRGLDMKMPLEFPVAVEQATKQFFAAIRSGADAKPSWKKNIYKNVAQFDQPIPESFRHTH
uniref:Homeobox protein prospero n=1 Tax=Schistocephalus solidus TaxID=70667 RepID=A0A0X3NVI3_SCHSO